ncbi:hypothetical protein [Nocardia sp. NPDC127526]|uniref:hypothetical protein n=1 Tax=Nocardia sp. NPDC127526 TaxID=3345393 RepID=UPI00362AA1B2
MGFRILRWTCALGALACLFGGLLLGFTAGWWAGVGAFLVIGILIEWTRAPNLNETSRDRGGWY